MNTIGVILAGGISSRMGSDKAHLKINNQTMLARTFQILEQTTVCETVISRNDDSKVHFSDIIPHKGPLSGIHSIAMRFPFSNLLVVPVDLPLIDAATLQNLIDSGESRSQNVRYAKQSLPIFLKNTEAMRQTLDYTLRCTNHFSVASFCAHFSLYELGLDAQSSLYNTNNPEQWQAALQHFNYNNTYNAFEVTDESFKQNF